MQQETVVAYLDAISWHLSEGTQLIQENIIFWKRVKQLMTYQSNKQ
jgi:hypothetical protein